jgi:hypothetical protein
MAIVEETKTCPYCAETIKKDAVVCRFCNYDLRTGTSAALAAQPQPSPAVSSAAPVVQARSGVKDGVKIGFGMFFVLPILMIVGLILFCMIVGGLAG